MNYAVIDLGSNSMRLSVYDCTDGGIKRSFTKKEIVGLAGYVTNGVLDATGIEKACMVLNEFKGSAARFVDVAEIRLFATASLRNIENRDDAVRIITEKTALVPDVLEGDEEATLGFAGVLHFDECESGNSDTLRMSIQYSIHKEIKILKKLTAYIAALALTASLGLAGTSAFAASAYSEESVNGRLQYLGSYSTGIQNEDGGVAEIVKYNSDNHKIYLVNGAAQSIDIVSIAAATSGDRKSVV